MNHLARYSTILFDLNGTLARDYDRFGPHQDYHATYTRLGGRTLASSHLHEIITSSLARLMERYEGGCPDDFPPYRDFIDDANCLSEAELQLIENTVAEHEIGYISPSCVAFLKDLSERHVLGIVSDLWAPAACCREYFRNQGLDALFGVLVFSSEEGAVKPSCKPFMKAMSELGAQAARTLFVGNDPLRDIEGAASCGMKTVLIGSAECYPTDSRADYAIDTIEELLEIKVD
ncbi:MAG: HAD family hydrolase [Gammaproteobacteria bacterium]